MCVVQISFLIVTILSLLSHIFVINANHQRVNPHLQIAPCVNMWSVTFLFSSFFFFLCHLLNLGTCICHIAPGRPSGMDQTTPNHTTPLVTASAVHSPKEIAPNGFHNRRSVNRDIGGRRNPRSSAHDVVAYL